MTGIMFFTLSFTGLLRVSEEEEARGLDLTEHEGPAYMIENTIGGPPKKKASVVPVV
jgi:ammonia channel protein AmtB